MSHKKEMPKMFEVLGMMQIAVNVLESETGKAKPKTELEKNALNMLRGCIDIISDKVTDDLSLTASSTTSHTVNYNSMPLHSHAVGV